MVPFHRSIVFHVHDGLVALTTIGLYREPLLGQVLSNHCKAGIQPQLCCILGWLSTSLGMLAGLISLVYQSLFWSLRRTFVHTVPPVGVCLQPIMLPQTKPGFLHKGVFAHKHLVCLNHLNTGEIRPQACQATGGEQYRAQVAVLAGFAQKQFDTILGALIILSVQKEASYVPQH